MGCGRVSRRPQEGTATVSADNEPVKRNIAANIAVVIGLMFSGIQAWDVLERRGLVAGAIAAVLWLVVLSVYAYTLYANLSAARRARSRQARLDNESADRIFQLEATLKRLKEQSTTAKTPPQDAAAVTPVHIRPSAPETTVTDLTPRIEITSPSSGADVGRKAVVCGTIIPFGDRLQVVVKADKLYLQGKVRVDGMAWSVESTFGREGDLDHNSYYDIIAVHGENIKQSPFEHLPENCIKSNIVRVRRAY
jgi:hypothetical protein